jgi:hypothetical protein
MLEGRPFILFTNHKQLHCRGLQNRCRSASGDICPPSSSSQQIFRTFQALQTKHSVRLLEGSLAMTAATPDGSVAAASAGCASSTCVAAHCSSEVAVKGAAAPSHSQRPAAINMAPSPPPPQPPLPPHADIKSIVEVQ